MAERGFLSNVIAARGDSVRLPVVNYRKDLIAQMHGYLQDVAHNGGNVTGMVTAQHLEWMKVELGLEKELDLKQLPRITFDYGPRGDFDLHHYSSEEAVRLLAQATDRFRGQRLHILTPRSVTFDRYILAGLQESNTPFAAGSVIFSINTAHYNKPEESITKAEIGGAKISNQSQSDPVLLIYSLIHKGNGRIQPTYSFQMTALASQAVATA